MRNGRKIANHACMNIRLTSKASAGKQNFCPAEAFLLTLKQILPDSQKSANYPYRVKEMQICSYKNGVEFLWKQGRKSLCFLHVSGKIE